MTSCMTGSLICEQIGSVKSLLLLLLRWGVLYLSDGIYDCMP
jgi:hypothetical protein